MNMTTNETATLELTSEDLDKFRQLATSQDYKQGSQIFEEGDNADYFYFIETGRISIFIQKFSHQEEVSQLEAGEYFGEMAFFSGDKRSASAATLTDTTLLSVDKDSFLKLLNNDKELANKINGIVNKRNEELTLKENLLDSMCVKSSNMHIGIKGDPSLRESAFTRDRYESDVDKIIHALQPHLYDILMNRCAYELVIHFNSGEIHTRSIFNPMVDEIHPANKLANKAYIERHFPLLDYQQKMDMVRQLYAFIANGTNTSDMSQVHKEALHSRQTAWAPMEPAEIPNIISRLPMLRKMQNFYLRNITISTIEDAVRMQFNCDGAHILSSDRYQDFLETNIPEEDDGDEPFVERRKNHRRTASENTAIDRRSPPGRRQEDWDRLTIALKQ